MSWQKVKLGVLYEVHNGLSKPRNAFGDGFPFLSYSTVFNNFFLPDQLDSLVRTDAKEQESYSIKTGDVFITRTSETSDELGMSCVALKDYPSATYNGFCKRLRPVTDKVYPRYIGYYLRAPEFRSRFDGLGAAMITRASLKNEDLLAMTVKLPLMPVQRKIADILGAYDDLIENNRRRIALLEKMARELYHERFVRDGSHLRDVGLMECSFISFCTSRIKKYDGMKRYLATADVDGQNIVGHGEMLQYDELPSRAQMLPELYSVWFARMSASYKILAFADSNADLIGELILSSGFAGFKSEREHWPYVRSFFSSEWFNSEKDRFATGATQISITNDGLTRIKIPVPRENDVAEYARLVNPIFDEVDLLKKQSANLARQRDRLLPRLMSGKIDLDKLVKGEEIENG